SSRASDVLTAWPGDPDLVLAVEPVAGPRGPLRVRVDQRDVAHVDEPLLVHDAALFGAAPSLVVHLGVLLDHADALNQHPPLRRISLDYRALAADVLARDHNDPVTLLDLHPAGPRLVLFRHHSTSGASEMIRMKRFSRNSRPTGPKMRVPRGSPPSLISTAAFSSKRMYDPSPRRRSLRVRTTTALTTSPFFTPAPGRASLTVATMTSPMPAYRLPEPPSTRMHRISLAPVLSATLSRDSCWITSTPSVGGPRAGQVLLRFLQDLRDPPALGRGQRPGLHQQDPVADAAGVGAVVGLVLLRAADALAVLGVLHPVLDHDHDGLVHLVADHEALADLAVAALAGTGRNFTHRLPPPPRAPPPGSRSRARAPASPCRCG